MEDTDEARSTRASENSILNDLRWLNLNWDEGPDVEGPYGPYRQSERKEIYKKVAEQLIASGHAYRCFCSEEELDQKRLAAEAAGIDAKYDGTWRDADPALVAQKIANGDEYTVRFRVPKNKVVSIDDLVRGRVSWDADASLGDFIIMRSNGMPVYNFCVAVDDSFMKITHVIRAEEHLTNTLRQMLILEALGTTPPTYAHCSLILGADRSKLSKRHGATSVTQFSEQGFLPDAMMNYLANLGFNDGTPKEIYTPKELIEAFDMSRIIKSPSMFDFEKLRWINGQHIRALPAAELKPRVVAALTTGDQPFLDAAKFSSVDSIAAGSKEETFVNLATKIAQRDMELVSESSKFVGACLKYDIQESLRTDGEIAHVLDEPTFETVVKGIVEDFDNGIFPTGSAEEIPGQWKAYIKALGARLGIKGKTLFHPARVALTGRMSGPDIGDQLQLAKAAEGVISAGYPLADIKKRIESLRTLNLAEAKATAAATVVRLEAEAKRKAEEAAAAAAAAALATDDQLVNQ